jgi:uncharacterized repeat protein (TIGR01451 family)
MTMRRFLLVPLAVLGALAAFAVSGAEGAPLELAHVGRLVAENGEPVGRSLDIQTSLHGTCVVGTTQATNIPHPTAGLVDANGSGSDVFLWEESMGSMIRLTDHATRRSFEPHPDDDCGMVAFTTLVGTTNGAVVLDRMTGMETTLATNAVVQDISGDGEHATVLSNSSGQLLRMRTDGTGTPDVVNVDSDENPLMGSSFNAATDSTGNRVVFQHFSFSTSSTNIFVRDIGAGTTQQVSATGGGVLANVVPAISPNGMNLAWVKSTSSGELAVYHDLATGMTTDVAPSDGTVSVNDLRTVGLNSPAGLDPADTNGENDAYLVNATTLEATWLSRTPGGPGLSGGSYPFNGNVVVANDDSAAAFSTTRVVDGTDTNGVEDGVRVELDAGGGGGSTSTSTTTTTTPTVPDVGVVKTAAAPSDGLAHRPGEPIVYTVTVTNHGTAATGAIALSDTVVPSGVGGSAAPHVMTTAMSAECEATQSLPEDPIDIDCDLSPLAPGASTSATYTVITSGPGEVRNTVTVTTSGDGNNTNNSAELVVGVLAPGDVVPPGATTVPLVDLVVSKTVSKPRVGDAFSPNEPITYTVEVVNEGDVDAHGVVLRDRVPRGEIDFLLVPSAVTGDGSCTLGTPGDRDTLPSPFSFTCELGTIPSNGGRKSVTYTVRSPRSGELVNAASAGALDPERDTVDNFAAVRVTVDSGKRACGGRRALSAAEQDIKCAFGDGDEEIECSDAICFAGRGADRLTCDAGAVCSGGRDRDRVRCFGEGTICSGGADEDVLSCFRQSSCHEDGSDDLIACIRTNECTAGDGDDRILCRFSVCRAQGGADFIRCDRSVCFAGSGRDRVRGGLGEETIHAADGEADDVDCGGSRGDIAIVDSNDRTQDCEQVVVAAPPKTPTKKPVSDLSVEVVVTPDPRVGDLLIPRVIVRNHGPDSSPVTIAIKSFGPEGEGVGATIELPALAPGEEHVSSSLRFKVRGTHVGTRTFTATVSGPHADPRPRNNVDVATAIIRR